MQDRDPIDKPFLYFVIVSAVFVIGLSYIIFPRHDDANAAPPSASRTAPPAPAATPAPAAIPAPPAAPAAAPAPAKK